MQLAIRYGLQSTIELEFPAESLIARFDRPRGEPVEDTLAATREALAKPIGFPSIDRAVVPGDRVTLALCHSIPQVSLIVAGVVGSLMECGISPREITILRSPASRGEQPGDPRDELAPPVSEAIALIDHNPADRRQLSYLASSSRREPILFHRALHDADVVLPIRRMGSSHTAGDGGIYGGIYPQFSDAATIERLPVPAGDAHSERARQWQQQLDEAGWLLGIAAVITVLPAHDGRILCVLAGDVRQVHETADRICRDAWRFPVPRRAALVIAAINGDAREQSWDNLARALVAAQRTVEDGGTIALCTELSDPPPAPLRKIADAEDLESALRRAVRDRAACAWQTAELIRAQLNSHVFLLSSLDEEFVRPTGMIPIAEQADLVRLIQRHNSCIIINHAQDAVPHVDEPAAPAMRSGRNTASRSGTRSSRERS